MVTTVIKCKGVDPGRDGGHVPPIFGWGENI